MQVQGQRWDLHEVVACPLPTLRGRLSSEGPLLVLDWRPTTSPRSGAATRRPCDQAFELTRTRKRVGGPAPVTTRGPPDMAKKGLHHDSTWYSRASAAAPDSNQRRRSDAGTPRPRPARRLPAPAPTATPAPHEAGLTTPAPGSRAEKVKLRHYRRIGALVSTRRRRGGRRAPAGSHRQRLS